MCSLYYCKKCGKYTDDYIQKQCMCRKCYNQYMKEWAASHRDKVRERNNNYAKTHKKEKQAYDKKRNIIYAEEHRERVKRYNKEHKEWRKNYIKEWTRQNRLDPIIRFKNSVRSNISAAITKRAMSLKKQKHTEEILGCSFNEFRIYIEAKFTEGMTWENYGEWELDHITPISLAKTEEEVYKLNHYTNFQPLWKMDNLKKSNKII